MRKSLVLVAVIIMAALALPGGVRADDDDSGGQATGRARLHQISRSGIRARILFLDSGSPDNGLVVSGRATGLDPTQMFFTLVYDTGALPGGPEACLPSSANQLTGVQMQVGFWKVYADGTGTLFAIKAGDSYVPLSDIGATSVRHVVGPPPEGFVLQACGRVRRNGQAD